MENSKIDKDSSTKLANSTRPKNLNKFQNIENDLQIFNHKFEKYLKIHTI